MLFKGEEVVPPSGARAVLAHRGQGWREPDETWITDMYTSALAQAMMPNGDGPVNIWKTG
jgi:hypothetical protein